MFYWLSYHTYKILQIYSYYKQHTHLKVAFVVLVLFTFSLISKFSRTVLLLLDVLSGLSWVSLLGLKTSLMVLRNWLPVIEIIIRLHDALRTWRKWFNDIKVEIHGGIWNNQNNENWYNMIEYKHELQYKYKKLRLFLMSNVYWDLPVK